MRLSKFVVITLGVVSLLLGCSQHPEINETMKKAAKKGDTQLVIKLLEQGADVNGRDKAQNATPLIWAAHEGQVETLQLLLDRGAEIEAAKNGGQTALWFAAEQGKLDTASLLLKQGANINAKGDDGVTALMIAKENGHTALVDLLNRAGAKD